jgi:hypothetical protein
MRAAARKVDDLRYAANHTAQVSLAEDSEP